MNPLSLPKLPTFKADNDIDIQISELKNKLIIFAKNKSKSGVLLHIYNPHKNKLFILDSNNALLKKTKYKLVLLKPN